VPLRATEYLVYRQLQEAAVMLPQGWLDTADVAHIVHAKLYNLVARYNQLASTQSASACYHVAAELLRKAAFVAAQPTLLSKWEDRLKIASVTAHNLGTALRRRGDAAEAKQSFETALCLWSAADLSGAPKFPLYRKAEVPLSLLLSLSAALLPSS
jgi:tetratricopeptide (TPR) repeat protein